MRFSRTTLPSLWEDHGTPAASGSLSQSSWSHEVAGAIAGADADVVGNAGSGATASTDAGAGNKNHQMQRGLYPYLIITCMHTGLYLLAFLLIEYSYR